MSLISSSASGTVLLADFVNVDASGKVNIIGGGIQFLGLTDETGLTAPFALFVNIAVGLPVFEETTATVEVQLLDGDGQPVVVAGPDGTNSLTFTQEVDFLVPGDLESKKPPLGFPSSSNIVLNFPAGLPLPGEASYEWIVILDGVRLVSTTFYVPAG